MSSACWWVADEPSDYLSPSPIAKLDSGWSGANWRVNNFTVHSVYFLNGNRYCLILVYLNSSKKYEKNDIKHDQLMFAGIGKESILGVCSPCIFIFSLPRMKTFVGRVWYNFYYIFNWIPKKKRESERGGGRSPVWRGAEVTTRYTGTDRYEILIFEGETIRFKATLP